MAPPKKPRLTPQQQAALLAAKIVKEVKNSAGLGLNAARLFLVARLKETLSVPAPRRLVHTPLGSYYVATTRATPLAPPRKLSGRARNSITSEMQGRWVAVVGTNVVSDPFRSRSSKYPKGFPYMKYHELFSMGKRAGRHKWIEPTVKKYIKDLETIIGRSVHFDITGSP